MKFIAGLFPLLAFSGTLFAQTNPGLFRYPDISESQIAFVYANDVWLVNKTGGDAVKVSSPPGVESFPKFSPDGKTLAFTGNYDGNMDVYVIPVTGGIPLRLTSHGDPERVVAWQPDGKKVLFASTRESGRTRYNQFYTISPNGGPAEKLPLAYGEFASYSPDGNKLALTYRTQAFRNWKRYRGGWKADIHIFDLQHKTSENITELNTTEANEFPMWHQSEIYFLSDRGPEIRLNLWKYDLNTKALKQLTTFKDFDIHFPSAGPGDIVFAAGGKIYRFNFSDQIVHPVNIKIINDKTSLKPKLEKLEKYIDHESISPDGKRILIEARGEVFSLPAENGYVKNISSSDSTAERYPAWSPDGKKVAYWSDKSGEYELWVQSIEDNEPAKKMTSYGPGFRYHVYWSPDSRKIAFIDKAMKIFIYDIETKETHEVDHGIFMLHGALEGFTCSWSPDGRFLAYSVDLSNRHNAVHIYDYREKKQHEVTSGFYSTSNPVFDSEGKYLFVSTLQNFSPSYSDIDNSFIYNNAVKLGFITLKKDTPSILAPKNDMVKLLPSEPITKVVTKKFNRKSIDTTEKIRVKVTPVSTDFDDIESRLEMLPVDAGQYSSLASVKGKLLYLKSSTEGGKDKTDLMIYDLEKFEEKTIQEKVDRYYLSEDREKILVKQDEKYAIIKPETDQKVDKTIATEDLQMVVHPKLEWKQILNDAWRFERDYFYDPNMHGVDWPAIKKQYSDILSDATTRDEVNFILGEMIGELNASHTYKGGGDLENEDEVNVGYLGADYEADGEHYKIKNILRSAPWDAEARSPLMLPGVMVHEGDYLLAVNGTPVTTEQEPYAFFQGLGGKTIEITYNDRPVLQGAKTVAVKALKTEERLRYLSWVEQMRKHVDEVTNGEVGYVYVPSTGIDGQNELIRQFNAQWTRKAMIIDERFNSGGQIPDRFIEVLNRTLLSAWAIRDGQSSLWPPYASFGPKVMLINGWSGSGGDAFPDYFRKKNLGPLIGMRTWGGLIGISGVPGLIDGGGITVPTFRMFNADGTWFQEGHGVDPDIKVDEDLEMMAKGVDVQLEKAISEIQQLLKSGSYKAPLTPAYEMRK